MKKLFLITIGLLLATTTWAGPFGVDMGMTMEQVKEVTTGVPIELNPGLWKINPKKTHPSIETYIMFYQDGFGVTGIRAVSYDIPSDGFGHKLKTEVEAITDALSKNYGRPTKEFDFLPDGSLWNGAHEYMMSLNMKERYYVKFWDNVFKEGVETITIEVKALDRTTGYYRLDYAFTNSNEASEAMNAKNATSL